MDRDNVQSEVLNVASMAKRWCQLGYFKKVYALSLFPNTDKDQNDQISSANNNKSEKVANSDEYFKMKMEDPVLRRLIEMDILEHLKHETGWDRVKKMCTRDQSKEWSDEVVLATATAYSTGTALFVIGAILGSRAAAEKFRTKSQHVAFDTKFVALRKYNDSVYFGGGRLGLQLGLRAGLMTYLFMMSSQAIAAYRNKSSVVEYAGAGGLTCGLLRLGSGWRAMIVGGVIGSAMGLVAGAVAYPLLKLGNYTQESRHYDNLMRHFLSNRAFQPMGELVTQSKPDEIPQLS